MGFAPLRLIFRLALASALPSVAGAAPAAAPITVAAAGDVACAAGEPVTADACQMAATAALIDQGLFIHEMTHVWQTQERGKYYLPLMRHPFCRYRYRFEPGRPFDRYGLEQQAEIVRHAFLLSRGVPLVGVARLEQLSGILPFQGT